MNKVQVWDLATRLFHWTLVGLIIAAWVTIENRMIDAHEIIGHLLLALIIFRVVWGFVGSTTSRFREFIIHPFKALAYLRASLTLQAPHSTGHNPAGGWMVIVMLAVIGFQVVSGLYANDDLGFSGALSDAVSKATSDTLTQLHALNFDLLVAIMWLHVAAVFFYVLVKKENLVKAKFTGKKPEHQINPNDILHFKSLYLALFILLISLTISFLLWW